MLLHETLSDKVLILLAVSSSSRLPAVPSSLLCLYLCGLRSLVITLLSALGIVTASRVLSMLCIIAVTKGWILRKFLSQWVCCHWCCLSFFFNVYVPSLFRFSDSVLALSILALMWPPCLSILFTGPPFLCIVVIFKKIPCWDADPRHSAVFCKVFCFLLCFGGLEFKNCVLHFPHTHYYFI